MSVGSPNIQNRPHKSYSYKTYRHYSFIPKEDPLKIHTGFHSTIQKVVKISMIVYPNITVQTSEAIRVNLVTSIYNYPSKYPVLLHINSATSNTTKHIHDIHIFSILKDV